jgi:hypothetical protein
VTFDSKVTVGERGGQTDGNVSVGAARAPEVQDWRKTASGRPARHGVGGRTGCDCRWQRRRRGTCNGGRQVEMTATVHGQRRGWLKNGNPPGDYFKAPRCGARNRRGTPCECPAMRGRRRCRIHGGLSTAARTAEGLERIRRAVTKHGYYSKAAKLERARGGLLMRQLRRMYAKLY